ncbi:MAG: App1 family protein [Ferruginibacter sp.]|nr:App1 family protein [Ferruginibacter sp.]
MSASAQYKHALVKVYHGYGHKHNLTVYGHVYQKKSTTGRKYNNNILSNIIYLVKLFLIKPVAGAKLRLLWREQVINGVTEQDGFYKFEWESLEDVNAGWHLVTVQLLDGSGNIITTGDGKIFVPHVTQFGFISDIDDTVMISHSATVFRRLRVLFTKNPRSRRAFKDVVHHYKLLSMAQTTPQVPNPFFYVSSSEWNLYEDLKEFFKHNDLPGGAFLLSQLKRWYQLFRTGKTHHEGKLMRVYRILNAFPLQQFVLIGDNSQADPSIYKMICDKYPEKIFAVYIRNVVKKNIPATNALLSTIDDKIFTCLFTDNEEAILHSKEIGLIS